MAKSFIKRCHLSSDSFIQTTLQLAHFRVSWVPNPTPPLRTSVPLGPKTLIVEPFHDFLVVGLPS